jgi:crotonobetainyl-CoA:carnitine CoA-transferase CaiB-like acyl-CoA transferase
MRPFEGIRILDLTHVLAGPFATYQLAVLGADVIKIEPPENLDMSRANEDSSQKSENGLGTFFQTQGANKRSMLLNLTSPKDRDIFLKLVKTADVMVQNYSGKALERLGLGYEEISKVNPQIIYCSMTGYGHTGPKAEHPAYDLAIQAYSGLMHANGTAETAPVRVGPAVCDYGTGAQAATAISAALFQRTRTGIGQHIDVSMLDAALMLMASHVTGTIAKGETAKPHGNTNPYNAGYSCYHASDELLAIAAWTKKQYSKLLETLGQSERANQILGTPRNQFHAECEKDTARIASISITKTADEWEEILNEQHVPAARVRTIKEAIESRQIHSRNILQPSGSSHPDMLSTLPVAAYQFAHGSPQITSPPPLPGEHTQEIIDELMK